MNRVRSESSWLADCVCFLLFSLFACLRLPSDCVVYLFCLFCLFVLFVCFVCFVCVVCVIGLDLCLSLP